MKQKIKTHVAKSNALITEFNVLKKTVVVEFGLVIILVLVTIFWKLISIFFKKNKIKIESQANNYFRSIISSESEISEKKFPRKFRKIDILMPLLNKLDEDIISHNWQKEKINFARAVMLPLARKNASSRKWFLRYYAAEVFGIVSEKKDEKIILMLINDLVQPVSLIAMRAGVLYGTDKMMKIILEKITSESRLTQPLYFQVFDNVPTETTLLIKNVLMEAKDPELRAICYRFLFKTNADFSASTIHADLNSDNMNLKISAIKFLSYLDKKTAIPLLMEFLKSDQWQIKVVALHCLGNLKVENAITDIDNLLKDSNWWVRLVAAQTLAKLGEKGKDALKMKNIEEDKYAHEVSQYVLDTLEE